MVIQENAGHYPQPSRWLLSAKSTITTTPMSSWKDTIGQAETPALSSYSASSSLLYWDFVRSSSTGECFAETPRSRHLLDRCIATMVIREQLVAVFGLDVNQLCRRFTAWWSLVEQRHRRASVIRWMLFACSCYLGGIVVIFQLIVAINVLFSES